MDKKTVELVDAIRPFMSKNMERHCEDVTDETTKVVLEINFGYHGGYRLNLTLKELRKLWKVYREIVTSEEYFNANA